MKSQDNIINSIYRNIYTTLFTMILYTLLIFGLGLGLVYIVYQLLFVNAVDFVIGALTGIIVIGFLLICISKRLRKVLNHLDPRWYLERTGWKECELPNWIFNKFYTITGHGWTDNMHYEELVNASERVYFKGKHFEYLVGKGEIWRRKRK